MPDTPADLKGLEEKLRGLTHSQEALEAIQVFSKSLRNTAARQAVFDAPGALLLEPPIRHQEAIEKKLFPESEDAFTLLQGDLVATDSAYLLGCRQESGRYLVANSTCDLVEGRRKYALLLPIRPIVIGSTQEQQKATKQILFSLLSFTPRSQMYLPSIQIDGPDVIANAVEFDGLAQIEMTDLLVARRIASLSLVGWRIFAAHLRGILTRAAQSEVDLRSNWM